MKIAIGCDHGGYLLKQDILIWLEEHDIDFEDVGRQHRMGAAASHRQGSPHHMPHGPLQRLRSRAVLHRQIHADLRDIDGAHSPAHRELLRIEQGRGRSPSRTDRRLTPQHGVIHLRRPPLGRQLRIVGVRNGGGIHRLHIRVISLTQ